MDSFDRDGVAQHRKVGAGPLSKRPATSLKVLINPPIPNRRGCCGCSPFSFMASSSGEAVIDAISVHRSGGLAQTTKSMIDLIDALNLPLPWSAWRKAESSLVMNFTIEFFRTRPSDEAHATLDRISIGADNLNAATVKAKSLFDTLDMPQKPDGLRILDQVKRELLVWTPDDHDA